MMKDDDYRDNDDTEAHARGTDPSTSHEAAERMRKSGLENRVYQTLRDHWPRYLTTLETAEAMGIDKWSISPRFAPLLRKGLVESIKKPAINSNGHVRDLLAWRAVRPEDQQPVQPQQPAQPPLLVSEE